MTDVFSSPLPSHVLPQHNGGGHRRLLTSTATPTNARDHSKAPTTGTCSSTPTTNNVTTTSRTTETSFSNYGLLLTLDSNNNNNNKNRLCLQFCPDHNLAEIHPNSYAPAALQEVHKLGGGGSGVAVFAGHHPGMGPVVLKHGSDKDLTELFALSTVAQELKGRGSNTGRAARHLQDRIPAFRMIYISPHHLGEKRKAMWSRLREMNQLMGSGMLLPLVEDDLEKDSSSSPTATTNTTNSTSHYSPTSIRSFRDQSLDNDVPPSLLGASTTTAADILPEEDEDEEEAEESFRMLKNFRILDQFHRTDSKKSGTQHLPPGVEISKSGTVTGHRDIAIVVAPSCITRPCQVKLQGDTLMFVLPEGQYEYEEEDEEEEEDATIRRGSPHHHHCRRIRLKGDGYQALQLIYQDLLALMRNHKWKFTMGQKRIGGDNPTTGNEWLYRNQLKGPLLDNLITQKIQLVRDLVRLTNMEEQDTIVLEQIREELTVLEQKKDTTIQAEELSVQADGFVGNAIRKNFKNDTGRLPILLMLGSHFREHTKQKKLSFLHHNQLRRGSISNFILTSEEEIPAYHLGLLTETGALMGNTFQGGPMEPTVLDSMGPQFWQTLLSKAVQPSSETSTMVWKRLWTCGLADAGLHNLFCSTDRLWLFDLGEPQLMSVPGFLTKFLFSFVHCLGMEEPADTEGGLWIRRFDPNHRTHKLQVTKATGRLLEQAYDALELALDRIVEELFDGDDSVRWLLLQYVTLQIVSDASFCLQKWTIKGGGRARDSNHQEGLEKWLWRALWDLYVACHINSQDVWSRWKIPANLPQITKLASQSLRHRQMALIQELALETVPPDSDYFGFQHPASANGFRPFVNANV